MSPLSDRCRRDRLERIGKPPQPGEMMKLPLRIANELNQLADTHDENRAANLLAHLSQNGTWQVPTFCVTRFYGAIGSAAIYGDERLKYVARQESDSREHNLIVHIEIP